jgi:hypothetical protein
MKACSTFDPMSGARSLGLPRRDPCIFRFDFRSSLLGVGGDPTFCFHMARIEVRRGRAMISDRSARSLDAPSPPANVNVIAIGCAARARMSPSGQTRRFADAPITSGPPLLTDTGGSGRHVSKAPRAEVAGLPRSELPGSLPLHFDSTLLWRGGLLQRTSQV